TAGRPAAHRQRGGQPDPGRVPARLLADPAEVREPRGQPIRHAAVELVGEPGGQGGGAARPGAADDDRRPPRGPWDAGALLEPVVLAVEAEPLPRRRGPQPGDDLLLLAEPVEPLAQRRKRDAQVAVLLLDPGGANAEFGPAAAHRVHGGDGDGERP